MKSELTGVLLNLVIQWDETTSMQSSSQSDLHLGDFLIYPCGVLYCKKRFFLLKTSPPGYYSLLYY